MNDFISVNLETLPDILKNSEMFRQLYDFSKEGIEQWVEIPRRSLKDPRFWMIDSSQQRKFSRLLKGTELRNS